MGIYSQNVWIVSVVGFAALFVFAIVYFKLEKALRAASWQREQQRRAGWPKHVAIVESCDRVTDMGDFLLELTVASRSEVAEDYRVTSGPVRVRGMARLSAPAVKYMETNQALPVRLSLPELIVDLGEIDGANAEAIQRDVYLARGTPKWTKVAANR